VTAAAGIVGEVPATTSLPIAARQAILEWYATAGRALPFRGTADPYAILVSEAMAQQTQAARAGEAWTRFIAVYPTPATLAAASPADVLRAWQGLGYNRRALNLWRAARQIVERHGGEVPTDLAALEALPGVGPYTARAVAAIAFGMPVGAVDTNVRRVLARIVAGDRSGLGPAALQELADRAVPADRPGTWTHALMDLGAAFCRPRRPACEGCPARTWCRYAAAGGADRVAANRPGRDARRGSVPFQATSRWLRGRIVDRLRDVAGDGWAVVEAPIGSHDQRAVTAALDGLARDGLIEFEPGERRRLESAATDRRVRLSLA
jgi:A/G-specific adenine glycosylase